MVAQWPFLKKSPFCNLGRNFENFVSKLREYVTYAINSAGIDFGNNLIKNGHFMAN